MSSPSAKLLVFVSGDLACIKINGRANFASSIDFKLVFNELLKKHYGCFVLDLADCMLMDSTFLGVLAGFGVEMSRSRNGSPAHPIELLNPNARVSDLLLNLGVMDLFQVITGPLPLPDVAAATEAPASKPTHEEVTRTCLEAHELLMDLSPANVAKFKDVTQFLAEDLKKVRANSNGAPEAAAQTNGDVTNGARH